MARISDLLASARTVSFEFFPPATLEGAVQLSTTLNELEVLRPDFVSVTYGAGGSGRDRTIDTVVAIERERSASSMAHLTCVGHTTAEIDDMLDVYAANGVENILALAGDPPQANDGDAPVSDFHYASDLVRHLRADGRFSIGVAAHPEGHPRSPGRYTDRRLLAQKLENADFAITQFFFDAADYFSLVEDLRQLGCHKPVVPGVIPILNAAQVEKFAAMAGAVIPASVTDRIAPIADDPDAVRAVGTEIAGELCRELLDGGAPGLHLYTLNRSTATLAVFDQVVMMAS